MAKGSRRWWSRYAPAHVSNPFSLLYRLLTSNEPAARSAVFMAAAGVGLSPLDLVLQLPERNLYARAPAPEKPILLVCGPPRSGTTLIAQYLINTLDVCYLNNLSSLFPRSPIVANRWFGRHAAPRRGAYEAYYGKSRRLSEPNDALYVWDRWLGADRRRIPAELNPGSARAMPLFFGALQAHYGRPVVNKVNRLNTCAHLVAPVLENARFLCVARDPLMLAQSLYIARSEIGGNMARAYGVQHPNRNREDPVDDVCRQVAFHRQQARAQQRLLGEARFRIVSYERFCEQPFGLATSIAADPGGFEWRADPEAGRDQVFRISKREKLPADILDRMRDGLTAHGAL